MKDKKQLPITLLSGFLGSGKTTLLEHILRSKDHKLRCAVIVNDMAVLNIDAELVKHHHLVQQEEKIVELQNGCICCTLREDLLLEVANLAEKHDFDYLVIESTGISEPIQVAETFTPEYLDVLKTLSEGMLDESNEKLAKLALRGGIADLASLDTCVTVIDCTGFFDAFETFDFLADRYGQSVDENDDRTISDLMVDQIEFANVIVLNKMDLVSNATLTRIIAIVKQMNPKAKVLQSSYAKIDLKEILGTNMFNFDEASTNAGWLQSIHEMQKTGKKIPKPETDEYGISTFVYTARRPFHPQRLMDLLSPTFFLIEKATPNGNDQNYSDDLCDEDVEDGKSLDQNVSDNDKDDIRQVQERLQNKKASVFSTILRSKGFIWLANRPYQSGEWSQAGSILTIEGGSPWFASLPEDVWPEDKLVRESIKKDFDPKVGDRRQELVFIGTHLNPQAVEAELDACLLSEEEWLDCEGKMKDGKSEMPKLSDPWASWIDEQDDHDHSGL